MAKFRVQIGHDAYSVYAGIIEADSDVEANRIALSRVGRAGVKWFKTGIVSEFDRVELLEDDTIEVGDEFVLSDVISISVTEAEHATILAALRYYQREGMSNPHCRPKEIQEIATNNGTLASLGDKDSIDALCEKINQ